jgi:ribonucleoside-diphosphate reductase beta chain
VVGGEPEPSEEGPHRHGLLPWRRALKRKVASTLLESFLFYSGLLPAAVLVEQGEADEHGRHHPPHHPRRGRARLLHRLQVPEGSRELGQAERDELKDYTFSLLYELYDNEVQYTQDLYDGIGLTEDVKKFLHYNANKALMNLGYEAMFPSP